jgi:hypothetical protein
VLALRHALCALLLIGAAAGAADRTGAQTYPDRLIKMVVPFPAGGRSTSRHGLWFSGWGRSSGRP